MMFKMKLVIASWDMLTCIYNILAISSFELGFFSPKLDRKDIIFHQHRLKLIIFWWDQFAQALKEWSWHNNIMFSRYMVNPHWGWAAAICLLASVRQSVIALTLEPFDLRPWFFVMNKSLYQKKISTGAEYSKKSNEAQIRYSLKKHHRV